MMSTGAELPDLLCLSHLRWNFVFQRPQHLLTRFAARQRVFFFEEPIWEDGASSPRLDVRTEPSGVVVAVPHLPTAMRADGEMVARTQRQLLDGLIADAGIDNFVAWYYTPMALTFSAHLTPAVTVYDCMDELSAFAGAPPELRALEVELLRRADFVTTGGRSLYEAKKDRHPNVHCFPSSVDVAHFNKARTATGEPADQRHIPTPRIGFAGVIDERMDLPLIAAVAAARPDWHLVILGPVVKIDPATLPNAPNVHYLGMKNYQELPSYLAGWNVAMLPFARNESTRFISPTKTPEYLAAGRPVVSTTIRDIVDPYGKRGLVKIADEPAEFVAAVEELLEIDRAALIAEADEFLAQGSWDETAHKMQELMEEVIARSQPALDAAASA